MTDTESLPQLPAGWCWTTIGDISEVKGGKRLPKGHDYSETPTDFPYIRVTDFENMSINLESLKFLNPSTQKHISNYTISKNDVYISIAGSIGKVGLIPEKLDGSNLTENSAKITEIKYVHINFLCYVLISIASQEQIKKFTISSNQPKLALFRIKQIIIPLPPLLEQHRIVQKIEELFTDLDAGVQALEKAKVQIKNYRQAVLKAAVEGKLTEGWRDGNNDELKSGFSILEKFESKSQKEINHKLQLSKILESQLPAKWEWKTVDQVANVQTGATPLKSNSQYYESGTIAWITSGALNQSFVTEAETNITELAIQKTNAKIFPIHTLLVAMYGEGKTRGKVSELLIEAATNQACAALIFDKNTSVFRPYVKIFFEKNYNDLRKLSSGGVQPNLNLSIIKSTKIPFPPLEEQKVIVSEIERRFSVIDQIEKTIDQSLIQAKKLRQSILKKAFEGKLVPQHLNDEPASVLLERIKQEKGRAEVQKKPGNGRKVKAETIIEVSGKTKQAELF